MERIERFTDGLPDSTSFGEREEITLVRATGGWVARLILGRSRGFLKTLNLMPSLDHCVISGLETPEEQVRVGPGSAFDATQVPRGAEAWALNWT